MKSKEIKDLDILIVGVGGQGTLLASVILGNMALESGYDVKLSEVHGMAQRGGSVVTHVRISSRPVKAPVIDKGGADMILAFELLEGFRWVPFLKKEGYMFVNDSCINPMPVIMGALSYPESIKEFFEEKNDKVTLIDALGIAQACGSEKAVNTVLLGAMSSILPFPEEKWIEQIEKNVKPAFVELNKKAFRAGREGNK